MKIDEPLNNELWVRLIRGDPLDGLGFECRNGTIDLSGMQLPEPSLLRRFEVARTPVAAVATAIPEIRGVTWRNFDFDSSKLRGLRLHACQVVNCHFDNCDLRDWRVWATTFSDCSFRRADLRNSVLGGVEGGARCVYSTVSFANADLRGTIYKAAGFEQCDFRGARLEKIDFQTSTFVDCVFEGELRDVLFYRRGHEGEGFPENDMVNVDFTHASLRHVSFRGLTLDRVRFPNDADHIVIKDPGATVDRLVGILQQQGDSTSLKLAAFLNIGRKWLESSQAQKVINKRDLTEAVGPTGLQMLLKLLRAAPQR